MEFNLTNIYVFMLYKSQKKCERQELIRSKKIEKKKSGLFFKVYSL